MEKRGMEKLFERREDRRRYGRRFEVAKRSCVINFQVSSLVGISPSITTANILKAAASFVSRPVRH